VAAKTINAVCENLSFVHKIVNIDGNATNGSKHLNFDDFLKKQTGSFNVYENVKKAVNLRNQSAVIFLSSGTTGNPKGKFYF
jgi:acyl-coenzyme A synthetase/AMP-(fatty) acid ligase